MLQVRKRVYNPFSRQGFPSSIYGERCVLYAPLGQEDMQGSPILSYNNIPLSMTVTGATWGFQGRTFDGDDNISIPLAFIGANLTILVWVKMGTDLTTVQGIVGSDTNFGTGIWITGGKIYPFHNASSFTVGITPTTSTWIFLAATFANLPLNPTIGISLNAAGFITATSNANTDVGNVRVGVRNSGNASPLLSNTVGEVYYFNRVLSAGEIMNLYLATKGRYQ